MDQFFSIGQNHPPNSFRVMLHLAKALDSIEAMLESTTNNEAALQNVWQLLQQPHIKRLVTIILAEATARTPRE